jgi:CBS domain-containing protein
MNKNAPVSEIMTTNLVVVSPNTTLEKVKELFETYAFHHVPVVNNHCLCGIISKSDLYRVSHSIDLFHSKSNEELNRRLFKSLLAEEVMASNAVVLSPDDTISHAVELLSLNQFHALPVVEGEKLVGILTTYDLIKYAYK